MIDIMTDYLKPIRIDDDVRSKGEFGYRILFREHNSDNTNKNQLSILLNDEDLVKLHIMVKNRCEIRGLIGIKRDQENQLENQLKICKFDRKIPAADVQEVSHGKWIESGYDVICSKCGHIESARRPFCSECGAKMGK